MVAPGDLGSVERSVVVPVPREVLWDALAKPEQLSRWFGEDVEELELRPGGLITFRGSDGAMRGARVDHVDPPAHLTFTWLEGEDDRPPSTVEFHLVEVPEGSRLTIVESLPPEEHDPLPGEILRDSGPIPAGDPPPDPPGAPPRILLHA
jgi:uncharacterized protein YndB with AHSA1/START domain